MEIFIDIRACLKIENKTNFRFFKQLLGGQTCFLKETVYPILEEKKTVLIVAHGNVLRALVKILDEIDDESISTVNIATASPIVYQLDATFHPLVHGGCQLAPSGER